VSAPADVYLQWKGTDVCLDFHCYRCNTFGHVDGFFASFLQCPTCGQGYAMPSVVTLKPVTLTTAQAEYVKTPTNPSELDDTGWESKHPVGAVASYCGDDE
jgi:hypothetical protein